VRAFSVGDPSSTGGLLAALEAGPEAVPEAIRNAVGPAGLRERLGSSLAGPGQSIRRAPHRAVMQGLVARAEPVDQEHVQDLALAPDLEARRVLDLEHVPELAAHRPPVRLHVRNALPTNAPAAAQHSIRRRRKAQ